MSRKPSTTSNRNKNMEKIARICWNTHEWKRPSGSEGKSRVNSSYEKNVGFGHEEWLLDDTRVMPDGYHYGFLQPMNVASGKHIGKVYDIHIFAISPNKQKVYIGCLHNVVGVEPGESQKVYQYYKECGWLKEMKDDVIFAGGTVTGFTPRWMFNVKFKFNEAEINYSNPPIIKPDTLGHRYNLMDKKGDFEFLMDEEGNIQTLDTSIIVRTTHSGEILIDPLHKKMQNAIAKLLKDEYHHLYLEKGDTSLTSGQRVDIKGKYKKTDEWHYFEIKTSSAKQSIREALGQILEYSHYDHKTTRATQLFIIGPEKPDEKDVAYIRKLREMYNLPIWFRFYSFEDNSLSESI